MSTRFRLTRVLLSGLTDIDVWENGDAETAAVAAFVESCGDARYEYATLTEIVRDGGQTTYSNRGRWTLDEDDESHLEPILAGTGDD